MPLPNVFVSKPIGLSFGEALSRLRTWLDGNQIEPASFMIAEEGPIGFQLRFSSDKDAAAFSAFDWSSPA